MSLLAAGAGFRRSGGCGSRAHRIEGLGGGGLGQFVSLLAAGAGFRRSGGCGRFLHDALGLRLPVVPERRSAAQRLGGCRLRGLALIGFEARLRIGLGGVDVLNLRDRRRNMRRRGRENLRRRRTSLHAIRTATEARAWRVVVYDHRLVVDIGDIHIRYVAHRPVVVELIAAPFAAVIA